MKNHPTSEANLTAVEASVKCCKSAFNLVQMWKIKDLKVANLIDSLFVDTNFLQDTKLI